MRRESHLERAQAQLSATPPLGRLQGQETRSFSRDLFPPGQAQPLVLSPKYVTQGGMPGWESPVSSSQSTEGLLLSPDPHQSIISVDLQGIHGQKEVHELRQKNFWKSVFFFFNLLLLLLLLLFIFFFGLCWVSVSVRGLSLVVASRGHSSSRCAGLSLSRPLLLQSTGSRRAGSVVVAHGPSRSAACGILPDQGSNPCPLHWQADSQPLRHQGSPCTFSLFNIIL